MLGTTMANRRLHPVLTALIAFPFATWLVTAGMYFASISHDAKDDDDGPDRSEIIVFIASPVVFPIIMLMGVLSNDSQQHRQVLEFGGAFIVAWAACWLVVRWLWSRLPSRRATTDDVAPLHRQ
jgi:hypothetical protein